MVVNYETILFIAYIVHFYFVSVCKFSLFPYHFSSNLPRYILNTILLNIFSIGHFNVRSDNHIVKMMYTREANK